MKIIKVEVNETIYEHIMFFLKNLPKNLVKVSTNNLNEDKNIKNKVEELINNYHKNAFSDIKDPLSWQKSIRDEWE